jgi:hypothetical protein
MKHLFAIFLLVPSIVMAHGSATSQEQTIDNYTVEFEYNTQGNIKAGDVAIFGVFLLQEENPVSFESAYIKISQPNGLPVLFGTLKEDSEIAGNARIGGIIKEAGEYSAQVQFMKNRKKIGPLTFKFNVDAQAKQATEAKKHIDYTSVIIGVVLAVGLVMAVMSRKRPTAPPV